MADLKVGHYKNLRWLREGGRYISRDKRLLGEGLFFSGEAIVADAANFGTRDGNVDVAVARNLLFELIVEMRFEFADFAAAQAGNVNVVARAVGFVVVAIPAKMEEIEFVDEALLLEEIDGAIDGDQVDVGANLLGTFENLIHVEMLFGVVHDLEDDAALASEADVALTKSLLEMAGSVRSVDAFAGRDSMGRCGGHGDG